MKVRLTNGILLDLSDNPNVEADTSGCIMKKTKEKLEKNRDVLQEYYNIIK